MHVLSPCSPLCFLPPSSPNPEDIGNAIRVAELNVLFEQGIYANHYKDEKQLGSGGSGTVFKTCHIESQSYYASKRLLTANFSQVVEECRILQLVNGPGVPRLYKVFHDTNLHSLHIIQEFIDGEPLKTPCDKKNIPKIFRQLLTIIGRAHQKNVSHRDIKPLNILVNPTLSVTVIDWGDGCTEDIPRSSVHGTYEYMDPEQRKDYYLPKASDMWSLGIILYKMFTGCVLFAKGTDYITSEFTLQPDALKEIPEDAKSLILTLLEKEPSKRISVEMALSHPFLQTV
ncbi:MAG: hypothetical protein RLZZ453_189 [Chlamydiota bacterium]|jgi:serine/threonine protein kinase